jgi:hypothetical protein
MWLPLFVRLSAVFAFRVVIFGKEGLFREGAGREGAAVFICD